MLLTKNMQSVNSPDKNEFVSEILEYVGKVRH